MKKIIAGILILAGLGAGALAFNAYQTATEVHQLAIVRREQVVEHAKKGDLERARDSEEGANRMGKFKDEKFLEFYLFGGGGLAGVLLGVFLFLRGNRQAVP